jgi:UDP-MurNAc hydroxylase
MNITFLGHAGFCVETEEAVVITDPWLSPLGAFDSAWYQFPRNHHLAAYVQEKLADTSKDRYVYISHEHKDHFDVTFLESLRSRDFTVIIGDFRRPMLKEFFGTYECNDVVACADGRSVPIAGGYVRLYLDDSELNRDSAILVKAGGSSFLNLNDCRLNDALPGIAKEEGPIDVFACQFSGASWHPTCYDYKRETYEAVSKRKTLLKFKAVAQGIKVLEPRVFVPSAGPPCFLDPLLFHLNFEEVNIFPRAPRLISYLNQRLKDSPTDWPELMPGDILEAGSGKVVYESPERVDEQNFDSYIHTYAASYESFFVARQRYRLEDPDDLLNRLRDALSHKLALLTLRDRVNVPLYFYLTDFPERMVRVDFPTGSVDYASRLPDDHYYSIAAPSWEVRRVLDGKLTWDDFSLTFRLRLNREPDVYQTVLQGFLRLEPEDMNWFCAKLLNIEGRQQRIVREAGGSRYVIDRYCPHQGGDLTHAWVEDGRLLTCPRHGWQFDLENEGWCAKNDATINAVCLDEA